MTSDEAEQRVAENAEKILRLCRKKCYGNDVLSDLAYDYIFSELSKNDFQDLTEKYNRASTDNFDAFLLKTVNWRIKDFLRNHFGYHRPPKSLVSPIEKEIYKLLSKGYSQRDIVEEFRLTKQLPSNTILRNIKFVFEKLAGKLPMRPRFVPIDNDNDDNVLDAYCSTPDTETALSEHHEELLSILLRTFIYADDLNKLSLEQLHDLERLGFVTLAHGDNIPQLSPPFTQKLEHLKRESRLTGEEILAVRLAAIPGEGLTH